MSSKFVFGKLVWLALFMAVATAHPRMSAGQIQIPINPPAQDQWIVDLTGQVPQDAIEEINLLCAEIFNANNREMVVVVIDSTNGQEPREYGTQLFNQWGVGSAFKNNGILILAALGDRRAEIIVGDGVDYDQQVRSAEKIMDTIIVPGFKRGDIGGALYEGARASATRILGIAFLEAPRNLSRAEEMRGIARAKPKWNPWRAVVQVGLWPWLVGFGILGIIGLFWFRHFNRYRARNCLICSGESTLLSEEQDDEFLHPAEVLEERLGSVDYDVWACLQCDDVVKIRYGSWFTQYFKCPTCGFKTANKITRTLVRATTSHGGRVRVDEDCRNCSYHRNYTYSTPRVSKSKGSSSGFSFGSGSSGRSSGGFGGGFGGGGRFGGGRSSGRGASGGW